MASECWIWRYSPNDKLISAVWDVEDIDGEIFGCVRLTLSETFTEEEKDELAEWIEFENTNLLDRDAMNPDLPEDGSLFIDFGRFACDDDFLLDDDEFEQHLGGQFMGGIE